MGRKKITDEWKYIYIKGLYYINLTRNGGGNDGRKIAEVSGAITPSIWTHLIVFLFCILVVRNFSEKWISKFFSHQRNHVLYIKGKTKMTDNIKWLGCGKPEHSLTGNM